MVDVSGIRKGTKDEIRGFFPFNKASVRFTKVPGFLLLIAMCLCVAPASGRSSARVRRERAREAAERAQKQEELKEPKAEPKPLASAPAVAVTALPVAGAGAVTSPVAAAMPGCDEACQQGRQSLGLERKLGWLLGGMVLVGLLQVGTVAWQGLLMRTTHDGVERQGGWLETQAGIIREQAGILKLSVAAAQTSADAALKQISHAVVSERPWVEVQLAEKELNFSHLKFVAQNRGSSPAKVTMYAVEKVVVSAEDAVGGPKYGNNGRFDEVEWSQWRLSGDHFIVGEFQLPPTLPSEVRQPGVCVLYQGLIRYNDTLTEDVHETRFCYEAFAPDDGAVRFRMFPAKGYNAMT